MVDDITKLAKRALELSEKATKGPLVVSKIDDSYRMGVCFIGNESLVKAPVILNGSQSTPGIVCCAGCNCDFGCPTPNEHDEAFIVESYTILPQLATLALELKEKYDELEARYQEVKANDGWKSIKDTEFFNSTASGDTGHPTKKDPK